MNKLTLLTLLVLLLCGPALVGTVQAQASASYTLTRHVIGSGGGEMGSTSYAMQGTAGQPVVGLSSSTQFGLCSGYWCGAAAQYYKVYLPFVVRNDSMP